MNINIILQRNLFHALKLLIKSSMKIYYNLLHYYKRYFIIDPKKMWHFVHYSECLYRPLPFYTTQVINPFLTSRISGNHSKGFEV